MASSELRFCDQKSMANNDVTLVLRHLKIKANQQNLDCLLKILFKLTNSSNAQSHTTETLWGLTWLRMDSASSRIDFIDINSLRRSDVYMHW